MGVSNQVHFEWLDDASAPIRKMVRQTLPPNPQVLGLGEQTASPFVNHLLEGVDHRYQACDLFPLSADVLPCDMNDLSPLFGRLNADIVCLFRSSYFIVNKHSFFSQVKQVLNPRGFLFMDLLVGSSDLPVLDFRYGDRRSAISNEGEPVAFYQTSFYDERLPREFPVEVEAFCNHARRWPRETQLQYLRKFPRAYLRDIRALRHLYSDNLGELITKALPEKNLFSLSDFEEAGFNVLSFNARYFYPKVKKFNLYCFVAAQLKGNLRS